MFWESVIDTSEWLILVCFILECMSHSLHIAGKLFWWAVVVFQERVVWRSVIHWTLSKYTYSSQSHIIIKCYIWLIFSDMHCCNIISWPWMCWFDPCTGQNPNSETVHWNLALLRSHHQKRRGTKHTFASCLMHFHIEERVLKSVFTE